MRDIFQLIEEGKYLFRAQKYQKAEELLRKVVESKKDYADVYNYLGLIYHEEGRYSEAIKHFKKALDVNARYTEAMLNLSILYNDIGDYEEAKKLVERSRKDAKSKTGTMDPFIRSKLANKHAAIADWYYGIGIHAEAVKEYDKAIALESSYIDIRTKKAVCLREQGNLKAALEELKIAVKTGKKCADAHTQLGITYFAMGKKAEARKVWSAATKMFPANKTIKMYLQFTGA